MSEDADTLDQLTLTSDELPVWDKFLDSILGSPKHLGEADALATEVADRMILARRARSGPSETQAAIDASKRRQADLVAENDRLGSWVDSLRVERLAARAERDAARENARTLVAQADELAEAFGVSAGAPWAGLLTLAREAGSMSAEIEAQRACASTSRRALNLALDARDDALEAARSTEAKLSIALDERDFVVKARDDSQREVCEFSGRLQGLPEDYVVRHNLVRREARSRGWTHLYPVEPTDG